MEEAKEVVKVNHPYKKQCVIRKLREDETELLRDFLYEAIFVPEDTEPPERNIIELPELSVYTEHFGEYADDHCLIADVEGRAVGAVWVRIMNDYGHVDDETPSLAISLYPEYRGREIGTQLLNNMLDLLKKQGYRKVSLSVQKANYAVNLYLAAGFRIRKESDEEYLMVCRL